MEHALQKRVLIAQCDSFDFQSAMKDKFFDFGTYKLQFLNAIMKKNSKKE